MWGLGTGSPLMVFGERFCLERTQHPLVPSTAALWWEVAPQEPHMTSSEAAWPLSAEHGGGRAVCVCRGRLRQTKLPALLWLVAPEWGLVLLGEQYRHCFYSPFSLVFEGKAKSSRQRISLHAVHVIGHVLGIGHT